MPTGFIADICDETLNFNFRWTASKYILPLFDNSILKMVKMCHRETQSKLGQKYDLVCY